MPCTVPVFVKDYFVLSGVLEWCRCAASAGYSGLPLSPFKLVWGSGGTVYMIIYTACFLIQ